MEMLDHEEERRIEESFYEERERMRKTTNLPKKSLDHTLLRTKKFFGEASDQKESPKFSPVDQPQERKETSKLELTLQQPDVIELAPRSRPNKQSDDEVLPDRRYRSKFSIDSTSATPKTVEFSPYKRPSSRRPRHSYLGKQNIGQLGLQEFSHETSKTHLNKTMDLDRSALSALELENKQLKARQDVYKSEIKTLTDQLAKQRSALTTLKQSADERHSKQQQLKELTTKIDQLKEENSKLKEQSYGLRKQFEHLHEKDREFQRLEASIRKELKLDSKQDNLVGVLEQMLKKYRRSESFVESISDMRAKITGERETNLKQLWRWLKKTVQEINSINDFLTTLREELRLPKEARFEELKTRLIKRLLSV